MLYLLHFDKPLHHARHYLGYTRDKNTLERRIKLHANPDGSSNHSLMRALKLAGISFQLVRVWETGDRILERKLKNRRNGPRECPVCNPKLKIQGAIK